MGIIPEIKKPTKMFTFSDEHFEPLINQLFSEFAHSANKGGGCCQTAAKASKWCSCINLSSIPTKAEELHVKVDEKSCTLTVSGKSETESTRRDGLKIFSTHVWTKEIRIPEDVELKTIATKLHDNQLTFFAERVQKEEDKQQEIPIEIVDTPALD